MGVSPIGGFMPIPLAMMIPFMAVQSMVMGDAFGRSYQYGKRKISAMTNEEFNAYTKVRMAQEVFTDYKDIIPALGESIRTSTDLQKLIVDEMLQIIPKVVGGLTTDVAETIPEILDKAKETIPTPGKAGGGPAQQSPTSPEAQKEKLKIADTSDIQAMYKQAISYATAEQNYNTQREGILERRRQVAGSNQNLSNQLMAQAIAMQKLQVQARTQKNNVTARILQLQNQYKAKYGHYVALAPIGTPA